MSTLQNRWQAIVAANRQDERTVIEGLLRELDQESRFDAEAHGEIAALAMNLVTGCRERDGERSILDRFMQEFGLSNEEGIALMCISEALLRIPDVASADALVGEKLSTANWAEHVGQTDSVFLNASIWALMLTGNVVRLGDDVVGSDPASWIRGFAGRMGESVARAAMAGAVRILAGEFVQGRTIEEALDRERDMASYDMLGEGARTSGDAERFTQVYLHAVQTVGEAQPDATPEGASGVSVKLSALHPRFEPLQHKRVDRELGGRLLSLARAACEHNLQFTVDAEEMWRLESTLGLFAMLCRETDPAWRGLGIAVQAYSKRAARVIDWLQALAEENQRILAVRLVKGAYWDAEIKRAQVEGLDGYPVYTRKSGTDLSYLYCAGQLLAQPNLYAQFATHNAHTLAAVVHLGQAADRPYEFQRLHGMGRLLYDEAKRQVPTLAPVRVYAPVGPHRHLLAYLVRRLLENGANTSFVNRFLDEKTPVDELVRDPVELVREQRCEPNPNISLPRDLYGSTRRNSRGLDLGDRARVEELLHAIDTAPPLRRDFAATRVADAVAAADAAHPAWGATAPGDRRRLLNAFADALENRRGEFIALLMREAGKTLTDGIAEVREAADFCRFYGSECERLFVEMPLPGPTGEDNVLSLHGRGVFACISPWNFPLAIFLGQVAAALAAGNTVVAKPAEQTPAIAQGVLELMAKVGFAQDVVRIVHGEADVGRELVRHPRITGVSFTGSTAAAKDIARNLAGRDGEIVPLIAETGGQNAMIVDSTALIEQVVDDVVTSAFRSAGQRCSSLRVLYCQREIADALIDMLTGAMDALVVGDAMDPATDVGPVIDREAHERLATYLKHAEPRTLHASPIPEDGLFIAPTLIEIDSIRELTSEHFGPVLHIVRFDRSELAACLEDIRGTDYGLTMGVHSRIEAVAEQAVAAVGAGNNYVNRDMIGAVVGVQPFGGRGLSGTGPKAGGPHYLLRFALERVVTRNTSATGGNAELLRMPP